MKTFLFFLTGIGGICIKNFYALSRLNVKTFLVINNLDAYILREGYYYKSFDIERFHHVYL